MYFLDDGSALSDTFEGFQKNFRAGAGYQRMDELRVKIARRAADEGQVAQTATKSYTRIQVDLSSKQARCTRR